MAKSDIFLIDDDSLVNYLNREIIKEYLVDKTVSIFVDASDAIEALTVLAESSEDAFPDFIFLDINMPQMDGWDFLDLFQNFPSDKLANCKVIMHTSSIDPRDKEKAKCFPSVIDFVSKPLTPVLLKRFFPV